MQNYARDSTHEKLDVGLFRVSEISLQSIWGLDSLVGNKDGSEERSVSAPERICALMLLSPGGGSMTVAFGGMDSK